MFILCNLFFDNKSTDGIFGIDKKDTNVNLSNNNLPILLNKNMNNKISFGVFLDNIKKFIMLSFNISNKYNNKKIYFVLRISIPKNDEINKIYADVEILFYDKHNKPIQFVIATLAINKSSSKYTNNIYFKLSDNGLIINYQNQYNDVILIDDLNDLIKEVLKEHQ